MTPSHPEKADAEQRALLAPCPFCGGEVELVHDHTIEDVDRIQHKIPTPDCPLNYVSAFGLGNDKLVAAWNTRADPRLARAVEALREIERFACGESDDTGTWAAVLRTTRQALTDLADMQGEELDDGLAKIRPAVFEVLRRHNVSEQCFAEVAAVTHALGCTDAMLASGRGKEGS